MLETNITELSSERYNIFSVVLVHYRIDKQGDIWVYKHMSKYVDEIFESLEEFHKYFKDY